MNAQTAALVAQAVAAAMASMNTAGAPRKASPSRKKTAKKGVGRGNGKAKLSEVEKQAFMDRNNADTVAVFTEAGFKDIKPRENVLTFKRWAEQGRVVKKGEHGHRVGPFNLFHIDQTSAIEAISAEPAKQETAATA